MKNNPKEVVLEFNLPEFSKKDVNIKLRDNRVSIKAAKRVESKIQRKDFFHQEKTQRVFSYNATLPRINPKKAKIEFKKGILKIVAPKK